MNESNRRWHIPDRVRPALAAVVSVAALTTMAHALPAAVMARAASGCEWHPQVLPLPEGTVRGTVTAGDGEWFAGTASTDDPADPEQGVLWHRGRLVALGLAFGLDTHLHAVNPEGVSAGHVVGADGTTHAIRRTHDGYEYLEEQAGTSKATDVNARGEAVGYDGPSLVVWAKDGTRRTLPLPEGEYPYGTPAVDDDGTVAAWTGHIAAGGTFHKRGYTWPRTGPRTPLQPKTEGADVEVQDIRNGRVVGTSGAPDEKPTATAWHTNGTPVATYPEGTEALAVNRSALTVGTTPKGGPQLWSPTRAPATLQAPPGHTQPQATTVNDKEAGGYAFPQEGPGSTPVRWRCR